MSELITLPDCEVSVISQDDRHYTLLAFKSAPSLDAQRAMSDIGLWEETTFNLGLFTWVGRGNVWTRANLLEELNRQFGH